MPEITVNGARLHYVVDGDGRKTVVMAHGYLLDHRMFDRQVEAVVGRFRCVRYDLRGHGKSEVTRFGYDMDSLTRDAVALIQELHCGPCHFVGFSMGGFVGQRLAVEHPELLRSLTLMATIAGRERKRFQLRLLCPAVRVMGVRAVTRWIMASQFSQGFLNDPGREEIREFWRERIASNDRVGVIRTAKALINRPDYSGRLGKVRKPTLIVVGEEDGPAPPEEAQKLQELIAGSELVVVPGAGHAVPIEEPAAVNLALGEFLEAL